MHFTFAKSLFLSPVMDNVLTDVCLFACLSVRFFVCEQHNSKGCGGFFMKFGERVDYQPFSPFSGSERS